MAYKSNAERCIELINENYDALENGNPAIYGGHFQGQEKQTFEEWYGQRVCRTIYVNAYEVGQAYGGPEEGGWWVTTLLAEGFHSLQ